MKKIKLKLGPRFRTFTVSEGPFPEVGERVRIKSEGDRVWTVVRVEDTEPLWLVKVK